MMTAIASPSQSSIGAANSHTATATTNNNNDVESAANHNHNHHESTSPQKAAAMKMEEAASPPSSQHFPASANTTTTDDSSSYSIASQQQQQQSVSASFGSDETTTMDATPTPQPSTNGGGVMLATPKVIGSDDDDDEEDNIPWAQRMRKRTSIGSGGGTSTVTVKKETEVVVVVNTEKTSSKAKKKKKKKAEESDADDYAEEDADDDADYANESKRTAKKRKRPSGVGGGEGGSSSGVVVKRTSVKTEVIEETEDIDAGAGASPTKRRKKMKKEVVDEDVWKWWEEPKKADGAKWRTLEHKGPVFAPAYERLPDNVLFKYNGKEMRLSERAEEVASFYAKMLDHDYTKKPVFNANFFKDWRKTMTHEEKAKITDLTKCDFSEMHAYFLAETEKRKAMSKEEKAKIKEIKDAEAKEYGFAMVDGHKQKIGNFRIEPPGLFRGRGDHPKMGRLKKRVRPEDVIINCSKGSKVPDPPAGHRWREVRNDETVTWLCGWIENVLGQNKYIMLNPSSKIKGEKDYEKFETARKLKAYVGDIRDQYVRDFKDREMRVRQRAVALYFIDRLALRAGNEKDTEEAADTVGCCSLRCEHIKLFDESDGQKYVVEFDFLGKDSIRYYNRVPVEKAVYKNLKKFIENKNGSDDLFDRLDTSTLNAHLRSLMNGLTAKVFRTYNASITLQDQLEKLTKANDNVHEKFLSYQRANRQVAILCNHQRAIPKTHEKSMENLEKKIADKKKEYKEAKDELKKNRDKKQEEKLKKRVERLKEQLKKMKLTRTDKDENKQIALGTSKLNYLDPRISVAWCKKYEVPIEKIFNKTQREKFRWAIDMADEDYVF